MEKEGYINPLVTVYIPTYNRLQLLQRAVSSVLDQSYENIELLVVDDNSDDDTANYLADISRNDSRIAYRTNSSNLGASTCRNIALQEAKGDFVTGLDDDDYFLKYRIEDFVSAWNNRQIGTTVFVYKHFKKI